MLEQIVKHSRMVLLPKGTYGHDPGLVEYVRFTVAPSDEKIKQISSVLDLSSFRVVVCVTIKYTSQDIVSSCVVSAAQVM